MRACHANVFFSHTHAMTTHAMFAPYKSRVVSRGGLLLPLTYLPGTSVGKKSTRPGLSRQMEELVCSCTACAVERRNPSEPMIASENALRPWQKVGTDMFVYKKATYLLVVDYASSYVGIAKLAATTSPDVIMHLRSIFARHGIPETVVSDNGPQYASYEFARFASEEGFIHITSSPCYPQSNGKAERPV